MQLSTYSLPGAARSLPARRAARREPGMDVTAAARVLAG